MYFPKKTISIIATAMLGSMPLTCAMLASGMTTSAAAQSAPNYTIPESEEATAQARIRAINQQTRAVTLVDASGRTFSVTAGPVVRLNLLKVGDRVDVKFYRSVAFAVAPPRVSNGVPVNDDATKQLLVQPVQAPGGVSLRMIRISGTIVGVDMASHRLELVNPSGGGVFAVDVTDPARISAMSALKIGDTVTAIISEALAISIEPARRRWF